MARAGAPGRAGLHGPPEGDGIVLSGSFGDGDLRWSFADITPSSFSWRNEVSRGGGATWRVQQTFAARRAAG